MSEKQAKAQVQRFRLKLTDIDALDGRLDPVICILLGTPRLCGEQLLHFDRCASVYELLFDGLGLFLVDTFLDRLRSSID
jgi:hypothetical protein